MAAKSLSTTETERTICSNSDGKEPNHIATTVKRKVVGKRQLFMWMTQMIASLSWFFACLIYKSYDHGDIWQFIASLSWTCSNLAGIPDIFYVKVEEQQQNVVVELVNDAGRESAV